MGEAKRRGTFEDRKLNSLKKWRRSFEESKPSDKINCESKEFNWENAQIICQVGGYRYLLGPILTKKLSFYDASKWARRIGGNLPDKWLLSLLHEEYFMPKNVFYPDGCDVDFEDENSENYIDNYPNIKNHKEIFLWTNSSTDESCMQYWVQQYGYYFSDSTWSNHKRASNIDEHFSIAIRKEPVLQHN